MNIKNYDFYYQLRTLPFVKAIYLFGSRANGNYRERSDVDLAIRCEGASEAEWQQVRQIIDSADTLLSIDCVRLDNLSDEALKREIEATKLILFERVENNYSWYKIFLDLGEALDKLNEVVNIDHNIFPYTREATIQVFEYSFELYWKLLQKICQMEGFETTSPRATFGQAYRLKLLDNEDIWLKMLEDRNLSVHTYKQPVAKEIYEHAKTLYCKVMQYTWQNLKVKYQL